MADGACDVSKADVNKSKSAGQKASNDNLDMHLRGLRALHLVETMGILGPVKKLSNLAGLIKRANNGSDYDHDHVHSRKTIWGCLGATRF